MEPQDPIHSALVELLDSFEDYMREDGETCPYGCDVCEAEQCAWARGQAAVRQVRELLGGCSHYEVERRLLHLKAFEGPIKCPLCLRTTRVYRWSFYSTLARKLILFYQQNGTAWTYISDKDFPKARWWGLIDEQVASREDGRKSSSWRINPRGIDFINMQLVVPKYAYVHDGDLLYLDGDATNIKGALGKRFDLQELLAAGEPPAQSVISGGTS